MGEDKYSEWEELTKRTATVVARDYPEVEYDDLFQDLMVWILGNEDLPPVDHEYSAKGLKNKATELAWGYRKQGMYASSQYAYRVSDIRKMMDGLFNDHNLDRTYLPDDYESLLGDDRLVSNSDLKYAYSRLKWRHKKSVFEKYALSIEPEDEAARKRLYRALVRMADILNTYRAQWDHQGPGKRTVITNATARYIIANNNDGGDE